MVLANSFWYFTLVFISLIIFIFIYIKSNHFRKDLAVYFFAAGLSFFMEFVVLILLDAYNYYPHIMKENWPDGIVGSLISQGFFIPIILMGIAAFQLRTKWVIIIISVIALIEELFLRLGIYEHNWWKTWYTIAIILLATYIMKWWRRKLNNPSIVIQFITIYMVTNVFFHIISFFISIVFKLNWYSMSLFESLYKDHTIINIIIDMILTIPLTAIVLFLYKYSTLLAIFILIVFFDSMLIKMGVQEIVDYKAVVAFAIIDLSVVLIIKKINDYLFKAKEDYI